MEAGLETIAIFASYVAVWLVVLLIDGLCSGRPASHCASSQTRIRDAKNPFASADLLRPLFQLL